MRVATKPHTLRYSAEYMDFPNFLVSVEDMDISEISLEPTCSSCKFT